jgi:Raf kinase inhibitor-like YbhB/YbcL family protein
LKKEFPFLPCITCDGDDLSPALHWDEEPKGTVTFALIMEDPDASNGTFTHWIVYNLPSNCHSLAKIAIKGSVPGEAQYMGKYY